MSSISTVPEGQEDSINVVAFYGVDESPNVVSSFFASIVTVFEELGVSPDKLSLHGTSHSGKYVSFSRASAKFQKEGPEGITAFSLVAMSPGGLYPANDFAVSAMYDKHPGSLCAVIAVRSVVSALSELVSLSRRFVGLLQPAYGIGYSRPHRLGPLMFAIGVSQGFGIAAPAVTYEEARTISRWGDVGMPRQVYRKGLIRDVFPANFLTKVHFQKHLGVGTLEQWICQDPQRGYLEDCGAGVTLWDVPAGYLHFVRAELDRHGFLFDWTKET